MNAGFAYTGRFNDLYGDANDCLNMVALVTATASYKTLAGGWVFSMYYKYTGRTPYYAITTVNGEQVASLVKIDAYQWADASVQKQLSKQFTTTVGIRNLFNVMNINSTGAATGSTHSSGPVRPIGSGRAYYLSLNYMFMR